MLTRKVGPKMIENMNFTGSTYPETIKSAVAELKVDEDGSVENVCVFSSDLTMLQQKHMYRNQ
jgi:hypothetical protein